VRRSNCKSKAATYSSKIWNLILAKAFYGAAVERRDPNTTKQNYNRIGFLWVIFQNKNLKEDDWTTIRSQHWGLKELTIKLFLTIDFITKAIGYIKDTPWWIKIFEYLSWSVVEHFARYTLVVKILDHKLQFFVYSLRGVRKKWNSEIGKLLLVLWMGIVLGELFSEKQFRF